MSGQNEEANEERVSTLGSPYTVEDFCDLSFEHCKEAYDNALKALGIHAERMAEKIEAVKKLTRKPRRSGKSDDAPATDKD